MNHHDGYVMDRIAPRDASKVVKTQMTNKNMSNFDIFYASLK